MDTTKKLRTISLCTGYGGIERGINLAGTPTRNFILCEIEAYAVALNIKRMESGEMEACPIWTDVKTFPIQSIQPMSVDIITGGYPCTPFSIAGRRKGAEDQRHLWPYFLKIIEHVKPKQCFFENVEGHINRGLEQVIEDLEREGYTTTWGIFSAAECGAPHQRKRVFILANTNCTGLQGNELSRGFNEKGREKQVRPITKQGYGGRWPARPGEQQHGWEAPRTVVNAQGVDGRRLSKREKETLPFSSIAGTREVESCMDRAIDGTYRIDRLRMLGNGVVPQTAAIAWATLNKRLNDDN